MFKLAEQIAAYIPGAIACPMHDMDNGSILDNRAKLALPDGGAILLITDWRGKCKAMVHIATRDLDYGSAPDMPECGFSPDASPKTIASNITRKLLPHVPDLLARVEAIRTAQQTRAATHAAHIAAYRQRFPNARIDDAGHFYEFVSGVSGDIGQDGRIYIKHLYTGPDALAAILSDRKG